MSWTDQLRRDAFEKTLRLRAQRPRGVVERSMSVGELADFLSEEVKDRALAIGNELILPHEDALDAIAIAIRHQIAVLGLESGEVQDDGFQILGYTGYDFRFSGDRNAYVLANNNAAELWIRSHRLGRNHGHVVTSAPERKFVSLTHRETK
jgi:hypothetical protein